MTQDRCASPHGLLRAAPGPRTRRLQSHHRSHTRHVPCQQQQAGGNEDILPLSMQINMTFTLMQADLEEPSRTWVGVFWPQECTVLRPQTLFATPQAKISTGYPLACNIFLPLSDNTRVTSTCDHTGPLYATSNQICTTPLRDATPGSLCDPHGSPENPVTRVVAAHMLMENKAVLIQDPNLTLRDATTTVLNISLPPFNPSASMRARQDEDNDKAPARQLINTCSWDPEHQNGLHTPPAPAPDDPTQGLDKDSAEHWSSPSSA